MTQIVDLGIQSFRQTHPGGQCLISRATATLMLGGDILEIDPTTNQTVNIDNTWITLKRKLTVNLHIEAHLDPSIAKSNFVQDALETVQKLLIRDGPHLQISMISHEYNILADMITLYAAFTLCEAPDQPPQSLPARLPSKVRGCAVDPHPPPGINRATLSHITIHMKVPNNCTPWGLFLTRLRLKDISDVSFLKNSNEEKTSLTKDTCMGSLRPLASSLSSPRPRDNSNARIEDTKSLSSWNKVLHQLPDSYSKDSGSGSFEQTGGLNELLSCAIRSLISKPSQPLKNGVDKIAFDEGPRLSEIAPLLFRPGYYENIRHRAGLVPVVTKSMAMILRAPLTSKCTQKVDSAERGLNSRYTDCADAANTGRRLDFRSLTRCAVWTALQKGSYKVEQSKNIIMRRSSGISTGDDCFFDSVTRSDEMLSDGEDENEQDSGYCSFPSAEEGCLSIWDSDSLSDDDLEYGLEDSGSESDDDEFELMRQVDSDEGDIIFGSSSLAPRTTSDITMGGGMVSETTSHSEMSNQDYACENEHDEDMIDN